VSAIWSHKEKSASPTVTQSKSVQVKPEAKTEASDMLSKLIRSTDAAVKATNRDEGTFQKRDAQKSNQRSTASENESAGDRPKRAESVGQNSAESEPPFKKHDHSRYVTTVKHKAIDQLNKHENATSARICRNVTTDQWSLVIYHIDNRKYSFTSYVWDEIDQKWDKSFTSGKQPVARWKEHLKFTAQGKECSVLKGGHLE
jgi:hypothetical protein